MPAETDAMEFRIDDTVWTRLGSYRYVECMKRVFPTGPPQFTFMNFQPRMLVLPTYSLQLPIELCHRIARFLHHPHTVVKNYLDIQRKYIVNRIEFTLQQLKGISRYHWSTHSEDQHILGIDALSKVT